MLDELIRLSGLSPIFAKTVIRRAVQRAGVDPDAVQRKDLERVLPEVERAMSVYVGQQTAGDRTAAIRRHLLAA